MSDGADSPTTPKQFTLLPAEQGMLAGIRGRGRFIDRRRKQLKPEKPEITENSIRSVVLLELVLRLPEADIRWLRSTLESLRDSDQSLGTIDIALYRAVLARAVELGTPEDEPAHPKHVAAVKAYRSRL